jgi:2-phospho-L-lactate guanylyltransferase
VAVAIVPDRHGTGTNALLLAPADAIAPSFGPGSFERHVAAARKAGVEYAVAKIPALMFDVDTPDDLADLSAALDERRGQAASTRGALRQLDRSRARASAARVAPASA